VVYEKYAEMTHKYDVQNFSKLLEDYNTIDPAQSLDNPSSNSSSALQSSKEATSYRFHFVQYQPASSRAQNLDLAHVPREELTPP
jgi:hypothetical protein